MGKIYRRKYIDSPDNLNPIKASNGAHAREPLARYVQFDNRLDILLLRYLFKLNEDIQIKTLFITLRET